MAATTRNPHGSEEPDVSLGETQPLSDDGRSTPGVSTGWFPLPSELLDHPRYEILEFLGAGGMGVVYKAEHRLMHRLVALKIINQALLGRRGMVERFQREVRAAARLTHPNIVHAYDADRWGDTHFLVMEYVDGVDLDQVLLRDDPLSMERACGYARQTAIGLQHAYERGMIHRDIKPHNLMVTASEHIKILDFGLARMVSDPAATGTACNAASASPRKTGTTASGAPAAAGLGPLTCADTQVGTADYLAPEVIADAQRADIRSDIYSLGCTLYRLLTGEVPCPAHTLDEKLACQRGELARPVNELRSEIPAALAHVVDRMLAKDPDERYQTPWEAAEALLPFSRGRVHRVLVVDDDAMIRLATTRMLQDQGYTVTGAANGQQALELLRAGPRPDLILLDLVMPIMDGWRFLQEQKQDPVLATIPVMVVSSNDAVEARVAAAGAVDFLRKPMHVDELAAKIDAIGA